MARRVFLPNRYDFSCINAVLTSDFADIAREVFDSRGESQSASVAPVGYQQSSFATPLRRGNDLGTVSGLLDRLPELRHGIDSNAHADILTNGVSFTNIDSDRWGSLVNVFFEKMKILASIDRDNVDVLHQLLTDAPTNTHLYAGLGATLSPTSVWSLLQSYMRPFALVLTYLDRYRNKYTNHSVAFGRFNMFAKSNSDLEVVVVHSGSVSTYSAQYSLLLPSSRVNALKSNSTMFLPFLVSPDLAGSSATVARTQGPHADPKTTYYVQKIYGLIQELCVCVGDCGDLCALLDEFDAHLFAYFDAHSEIGDSLLSEVVDPFLQQCFLCLPSECITLLKKLFQFCSKDESFTSLLENMLYMVRLPKSGYSTPSARRSASLFGSNTGADDMDEDDFLDDRRPTPKVFKARKHDSGLLNDVMQSVIVEHFQRSKRALLFVGAVAHCHSICSSLHATVVCAARANYYPRAVFMCAYSAYIQYLQVCVRPNVQASTFGSQQANTVDTHECFPNMGFTLLSGFVASDVRIDAGLSVLHNFWNSDFIDYKRASGTFVNATSLNDMCVCGLAAIAPFNVSNLAAYLLRSKQFVYLKRLASVVSFGKQHNLHSCVLFNSTLNTANNLPNIYSDCFSFTGKDEEDMDSDQNSGAGLDQLLGDCSHSVLNNYETVIKSLSESRVATTISLCSLLSNLDSHRNGATDDGDWKKHIANAVEGLVLSAPRHELLFASDALPLDAQAALREASLSTREYSSTQEGTQGSLVIANAWSAVDNNLRSHLNSLLEAALVNVNCMSVGSQNSGGFSTNTNLVSFQQPHEHQLVIDFIHKMLSFKPFFELVRVCVQTCIQANVGQDNENILGSLTPIQLVMFLMKYFPHCLLPLAACAHLRDVCELLQRCRVVFANTQVASDSQVARNLGAELCLRVSKELMKCVQDVADICFVDEADTNCGWPESVRESLKRLDCRRCGCVLFNF
jgi:hypothetical protein